MSQALYRKWRPARFDEVIGQEHVTRTLRNAVVGDRVSHAYLFCGPRGTGKTTTARLLAKALNCLHEDPAERPCNECRICKVINQGRYLDLIEIDAASNTGVDDIRSLRDKINFSPSDGRFKVYIIDEVHMLSTAAFNALLKTLEEPPPHAIFVLATTEEHKVPATIKSRCQQFNFRLLTQQEIVGRLQWMSAKEDLTVEPEALNLVARHGAGSLRDAESLLDQLVSAPGDTITLERTQTVLGTATMTAVADLTAAWLEGDGAAGLAVINESLSTGTDARQFCRQMVTYLRELLLLQAGGPELQLDMPAEEKDGLLTLAARTDRRLLIETMKRFNEAAVTPANTWQPQMPLELAFIESLPAQPQAGAGPIPARSVPRRTVSAAPAADVAASPSPAPARVPAAAPTRPVAQTPAQTAPPPVRAAEPAPARTAAPPPVGGETAGTLVLGVIKGRWPELVQRCGEHDRNLPPLLAMCEPLATEVDTLVLGFDYGVLRDKFDQDQNRTVVAEVLSEISGTRCQVRAVVTSSYVPPQPTISRDDIEALANELGGVVNDGS